MERGTPELLKIMNKRTILSLIMKEKVISRAQISSKTNLSKTTVSMIVDELLSENIIKESGEGESTKQGGRKPIELTFNPLAGYIVGIDIGAYKSLCVVSDLSGRIIGKKNIITPKKKGDGVLKEIIEATRQLISEQNIKDKLIGMGVGIPGTTDIENGIAVIVPKLNWNNLRITDILSKEFNMDVYIDNDVNMAVLGEKWMGAGKKYSNFVFISIGDGIGSGIIIDDKIYRGSSFSAGEVGYLALSKEALRATKYTPDTYGFFESVASGSAIEQRMGISCKEAFEKAMQNDKEAMQSVNEMIDYLSMGIANVISILNPQAVILGGGVSRAGINLLLPIRNNVSNLTPVPCDIVLSALDDEAGVMGCIATVLTNKYGITM